jgi:F-type H+-transporting ATPase subunit a
MSETATDTTHTATNTNGGGNVEVFNQLYSQLGDHHGFYIAQYHICDLPYIIWDEGQLHLYGSEHSMEEAGLFREVNHSIVRASDGAAPQLDLSITNLVMFQWIAMLFIFVVFGIVARKKVCRPDKAPHGFFANAAEKICLYIRDEVSLPNFKNKKIATSLNFYFVATFIFILVVNLLGLLPGGHAATGSIPVTASLAVVAFFVINGASIRYVGFGHWLKELTGGAPLPLAPIMVPIEILGLFIKPFALTVRLFANMTAGHIVLFSLIGLLFFFHNYLLSVAIVPFSVFIYLLETLVAFIQAFVFTVLTAIYTGTAIGSEH